MEKNILLNLPNETKRIETIRIVGITDKETRLLSAIKYYRGKNYSDNFIYFQLELYGYSESEIKKGLQKIKRK